MASLPRRLHRSLRSIWLTQSRSRCADHAHREHLARATSTGANSMHRCSVLRSRSDDPMRISPPWALVLLGVPVAFLFAFFILPFGVVVLDSLRTKEEAFTLEHYAKALGDFYYWETLLLTFKLSLFVTVVTLLIGYPLAYFTVRHVRNRRVRSLIYIVVVTPLFTSNIVRAFGWMVLLGRRGIVNDLLQLTGFTDRPLPLLYGQTSSVVGLTYIMAP